MNSNFNFARRAPASITEELVAVLSGPKSYEFKALFLVIQAALRARNAISGGEEMLRSRAYDKLQNLVKHGQVKKTAKQYKGVRKDLLLLAENLKALREIGPTH
jgi:predicted transcriptional regulator